MNMKIRTQFYSTALAAVMMAGGFCLTGPEAAAQTVVTLQGPSVTKDTYVRRSANGFAENENNGTAGTIWVRERYQSASTAGLIEFDISGYIGGPAVENVSLSLFHNETWDGTSTRAIAIRPLKLSWEEDGATFMHRDAPNGSEPWAAGTSVGIRSDYTAQDPSTVLETGNFGPRLATVMVDGNNPGNWHTWESQALDDYMNEVIAGNIVHYGFIIETGMYSWGDDTLYRFRSSNYTVDPSLQPIFAFTVIPEPRIYALIGGLFALGVVVFRRRLAHR